jgi:hypothetical protein
MDARHQQKRSARFMLINERLRQVARIDFNNDDLGAGGSATYGGRDAQSNQDQSDQDKEGFRFDHRELTDNIFISLNGSRRWIQGDTSQSSAIFRRAEIEKLAPIGSILELVYPVEDCWHVFEPGQRLFLAGRFVPPTFQK